MDNYERTGHLPLNFTNILVIDNDTVSKLIRKLLAKAGGGLFSVFTEPDFTRALKKVRSSTTHVVLLNLAGADASGGDPLKQILEQRRDIPVIILATKDERDLAIEAVQNGAQDYLLTNQLKPDLLVRIIYFAIKRKQIENALGRSIREWHATFDAICDPIALVDTEGLILKMNTAFARLTGEGVLDLIGHDFYDIVAGIEAGFDTKLVRAMAANVNRQTGEFAVGSRFYHISVDPLLNAAGDKVGSINILRDTTAHKKNQEDRIKADKVESLSLLSAGVAHDFNNLLTGILGNISLLAGGGPAMAERDKLLEEVRMAALQARKLTRQLLLFSREGAPMKRPCHIEEMIVKTAGFTTRNSNCRLESKVEGAIRPVDADEGQIGQVIQNLVINAVQAMPDGGEIRLNIANRVIEETAGMLSPGPYVCITIADNGPGIPADVCSRVFDPYFTTKTGGNGLGLAISSSIIAKHGGSLTMETQTARGTAFTILLPATAKPVSEQFRKALSPPSSEPVSRTGRILVMDDDRQSLVTTVRILEYLGYEAEGTADGSDAIKSYQGSLRNGGRRYAAVILDLTVPGGMGGEAAARSIRRMDTEARLIAASGYAADDSAPGLIDEQIFNLRIVKPFEISELAQALQTVLSAGMRRQS